MEANLISTDEIYDKVKNPSKPHIAEGQELVTKEEMESRMRVAEELEYLGISISRFDAEAGYEDSDELQAILLVSKGKKIPEDLKKRLMDKQKQNSEKKRVKRKASQ